METGLGEGKAVVPGRKVSHRAHLHGNCGILQVPLALEPAGMNR